MTVHPSIVDACRCNCAQAPSILVIHPLFLFGWSNRLFLQAAKRTVLLLLNVIGVVVSMQDVRWLNQNKWHYLDIEA